MEKPREFQKNIYFCFIDYAKAFDCVDHNKLWKISQEAGQVVWYSHLLKNFPQFVVIHTVKGFSVINEAGVDIFPGTPLLSPQSKGCSNYQIIVLVLHASKVMLKILQARL